MNLPKTLSTRVNHSIYDKPREHTRKPLFRDYSFHSPERQHKMTYTAERSDFNPPPPRSQTHCRDEYGNPDATATQLEVSKTLKHQSSYSQDSYRTQEHQGGRFHPHNYEMHYQYHPGYYDPSYLPAEYTHWQGEGEQGSMTIEPFHDHPAQKQYNVPEKIDHTYRDFSGISPSAEDLERYQNKKKEYNRRAKKTGSPEKKVSTKSEESKGKVSKNRGRGNKSNESGEDAFIGFMGTNFPARLHDLLSHERGISDIITWLPHGRSWIVLDKKQFLEKVAPSHFQISKFESFTRQVNGWGFKRITQGPDINSYYHELFLQGMPHLIQWMKRATSSGLGKRKFRSDPRDEPDFYEISKRYPIPDYYNENGGKPITPYDSSSSGPRRHHHQQQQQNPPKHKEHDDNMISRPHEYHLPLKREASLPEPVAKRYKLSPPGLYHSANHNQTNYHHNRVSTPQRKWNATSNAITQQNLEQRTSDQPRGIEDNDQNSMIFSPTCYYSPGTKIGRDLKDLNVLRDITVDDFWRNVPTVRERPIYNAPKKENDLYELYDFPVPIVSNEESSASPDGELVTKHQWQTLYDSLLDCDDPPHLTSNASSQQHIHPANKSSNQPMDASQQYRGARPGLPPRQKNPYYYCPPRLSRTSYSSIRANYTTSGHMWRSHPALESNNRQNFEQEDRMSVVGIQNNDKYQRATDEVRLGESKDERGGGGGGGEKKETKDCATKQNTW